MPTSMVAAARTPWAVRHGSLDGVRPEVLLATALAGAMDAAGGGLPDRILVGCDEPVGSQDHNVGRRAALELGWDTTPALTVDGHGSTGLALVALASSLPGRTLVAGVDTCSQVPPGAGLVRDYGRPTRVEPEIHAVDRLVRDRGIGSDELDVLATRLRAAGSSQPPVCDVAATGARIGRDDLDDRAHEVELATLVADGVLTAFHVAEYADGAAAALIETGGGDGRSLTRATLEAGAAHGVWSALGNRIREPEHAVVLAAVTDAGTAALLGLRPGDIDDRVSPVLATGSTPSVNGLRLLVDAFTAIHERVLVVDGSGDGQQVCVELEAW